MFFGKSILVTGASSGLGESLALSYATAGAKVCVFAIDEPGVNDVARRIQARGGEAVAVVGDVSKPDDCRRAIEAAVGAFGGLDILVNNAGVSMWARFEEIEDLGAFRRLVEVNYLGAVYCTHYALPHLKSQRGMIVAVTSIQGRSGVPFHTGYAASKHAMQGFFDSLRMELELEGMGVHVLTVLPHWLRGTKLRENALDGRGGTVGETSARHTEESIELGAATAAILEAMRRRKRELVIPFKLQALLWLRMISPRMADEIVKSHTSRQR